MVTNVSSTDDYARRPVPDSATVHGVGIGVVVAGVGATLPMFQVGSQLAIALGLRSSSVVFFAGCVLVGLLTAATSVVGSRARLSTYVIMAFPFGRRGAQVVNILLGIMLIGWFATTSELLGAAIHDAVANIYGVSLPTFVLTVVALAAMTVTAIFGFRLMERFALFTVPLLMVLMSYVVLLSLTRQGLGGALGRPGDHTISGVDALSSVIGVSVLTAVLAPDLTRYARNDRHSLLSVLGVVIGYPVALLVAAIPAAVLTQIDLMKIMIVLGIPGVAISVLIMSTWTSNTSNLYCSTLTLATLFPHTPIWKLGSGGALVALVAAVCGLADHFVPLLIILGVISAPLAGIYVADFFVLKRQSYNIDALASGPSINMSAIGAWCVGSVVGVLATNHHARLTTIPAADSVIVASAMYLLLNARLRRGRTPASAAAVEPDTGPCA